ncbi:unnamed protein product [Durusdinium trenchii]|uniref:14-3-3 domain-containing protein n=1 Tax=Durusdinium trenchii TaxID=1381693 RepID=A0ABP0J7Y9_9DINO
MGRRKQASLPPEEEAIILANVAERAERYDDMVEYMKDRVKAGKALSREEREMLAAAFKEEADKEKNAALTSGYLTKVRLELQGLCIQILELIEGILLPKAENGEPMVFYKKLQADYYRYLAEFLEGDGHKEAVASAIEVYADATAEAERHLMVTHPVRLGLALNYAVFQQVIRKDDSSAVRIAKVASSISFVIFTKQSKTLRTAQKPSEACTGPVRMHICRLCGLLKACHRKL